MCDLLKRWKVTSKSQVLWTRDMAISMDLSVTTTARKKKAERREIKVAGDFRALYT